MAAHYYRRPKSARKTELPPLYTVGHSIHRIEFFLELLTRAAPRVHVLDVRSSPRARRPWFNRDPLAASLTANGHAYTWLPALGGRQSVDFYDYMDTREFDRSITRVLALQKQLRPLVLVCAEANPEECHRWMIATELAAHDREIFHVLKSGKLSRHTENLL